MANQVHHHPDGTLHIRTQAGAYADSLENFAGDYGAPFPALDAGLTERIYDQGVRHAVMNGHDVVGGGPMPWPEGDTIIASIGRLIAAQEARFAGVATAKAAETAAARAAQAAQVRARSPSTTFSQCYPRTCKRGCKPELRRDLLQAPLQHALVNSTKNEVAMSRRRERCAR